MNCTCIIGFCQKHRIGNSQQGIVGGDPTQFPVLSEDRIREIVREELDSRSSCKAILEVDAPKTVTVTKEQLRRIFNPWFNHNISFGNACKELGFEG